METLHRGNGEKTFCPEATNPAELLSLHRKLHQEKRWSRDRREEDGGPEWRHLPPVDRWENVTDSRG